ncbi:LAME_0E06040g1_1 [Lachancea meyersii CBS 8951]|uniref:LAME_0E06040g1_1 n=1 Tax=Lachancea meyersii CBS 8951 TaxID=1266667 RepID=A0A1G4JIE4_9SACH|nr:LAME_0E06040g1_1 [Lachancea meyersii CBS 8951]
MTRDECPICLEPLDETRSRLVDCGHEYHFDCIRKWHQHSQDLKCPTCRKPSHYLEKANQKVKIDLRKCGDANRAIVELAGSISNLALEPENQSRSWTLSSLECGICGTLDSEINRYCTVCYTAYHERCLRVLQLEVGDFCHRLFCCNCHQAFADSDESSSVRSRTIQRLDMPRIHNQPSPLNRGSNDPSEIDESWKLLSQLQSEARLQAIASHKRSIQNHVRRALNLHFFDSAPSGCRTVDKKQFTDINKSVSRRLYRMSDYVYCPESINYDDEARRLIQQELSRLCPGPCTS